MDLQEILAAAQKGDLEAYNQIVLSYQDVLYHHIWWIVQDHDLAEDLTQEVFIKVYQRLHQFRGGGFKAWLLRIATNSALDELRSRSRRNWLSLDASQPGEQGYSLHDRLSDPMPGVEAQVEAAEQRQAIETALAALPVEYRLAVGLVDFQQLPYAQAAQVMRVSIGTVKSRVARGRALLRGRLTRAAAGPLGDTAPLPACR